MRVMIDEAVIVPAHVVGFEVVERKGLGHPDSLADLVAEEFSRRYARFGREHFGIVPNHWVDKVALVGAGARVGFGAFRITKPPTAYLFGKVTGAVGGVRIPVVELFEATVSDVLTAATGTAGLARSIRCVVENTSGTSADHPSGFYQPTSVAECAQLARVVRANDTAFCAAYAPLSPAERLVMALEHRATGPELQAAIPALGSDVKVMLVRTGTAMQATMCLPVHPDRVGSRAEYDQVIRAATTAVTASVVEPASGVGRVRLTANTKDAAGGAYLAPFGTSLGKGDCGLVGRGNRANGVISAVRCAGVEALAGKNPVHHTGKLYTLATQQAADDIYAELGLVNEVVAVSRNGAALNEPAFVGVRLADRVDSAEHHRITELVGQAFADLDQFGTRLLDVPAIDRFRGSACLAQQVR